MPKKVTPADAKEKWNFYFPQLLKLEMHRKLLDMGKQGKQSALLRSLVRMFVDGDIPVDKLAKLIDEETYIKQSGEPSTL